MMSCSYFLCKDNSYQVENVHKFNKNIQKETLTTTWKIDDLTNIHPYAVPLSESSFIEHRTFNRLWFDQRWNLGMTDGCFLHHGSAGIGARDEQVIFNATARYE